MAESTGTLVIALALAKQKLAGLLLAIVGISGERSENS